MQKNIVKVALAELGEINDRAIAIQSEAADLEGQIEACRAEQRAEDPATCPAKDDMSADALGQALKSLLSKAESSEYGATAGGVKGMHVAFHSIT